MATEYRRIQNLIYTAAEWTAKNPVLLDGEMGVERDTNKAKYGDGRTAWNSLEYTGTEVDLSNYYTKGETDTKFATGQMVNNLSTDLNRKLDEKADKTEIPSLDEYYTKEEIDGKVEAIDYTIATKADQETVDSRFGSVDEYLDDLQKAVEGKADISSLEEYYIKEEIDGKVQAIDYAIATKADQEEVNNRFGSVDEYLEQLHSEIENKADASAIPTKTSDLENDSDYATNEGLKAVKDEVEASLANKVEQNEFVQRCEAIEGEVEKVDNKIPTNTETWTFEMEDGTITTKEIYIKQ